MNQPTILSLGEVLWDLFPEGARFGGAPANFACHAAALGGDVTMVSAVGNDTRGREALSILESYDIRTDLIQTPAGTPTGTVGIELDKSGKPTFTIHEGSAWDQLAWSPELEKRIGSADAVYFGTLGQRSEDSLATIRRALAVAAEKNVLRVLDVNLRAPFFEEELIRESVNQASILKLSDDELAEVCTACDVALTEPPEVLLTRLLDDCDLDLIVMTRGAEGALLVSPGGHFDQPGIPTTVCDTVGAGDAFTASFLIGLLRGDGEARLLESACERAAEVCSQSGAVPDPVAVNS